MAELYLVRHGQAAFGTDDYDRLSPLGEAQSRWLGEYFAERDLGFNRVFCGTLKRQRATVKAIYEGLGVDPAVTEHPDLNEYDFAALVARFRETADLAAPPRGDHIAFYRLLKQALQAWTTGELDDALTETWAAFRERAARAIAHVQHQATRGERVLVVSSGGPISAIVGTVLELADRHTIELNLQLYNTGLSRLYFNVQRMVLASFNALPHLDRSERFGSITYG